MGTERAEMVSVPELAASVKSDVAPAPVTVRATAEEVLVAKVASLYMRR